MTIDLYEEDEDADEINMSNVFTIYEYGFEQYYIESLTKNNNVLHMDNKNTTLLGVSLAALTVGLGYLGYTIVNNNSKANIPIENASIETETLEEEAVKNVENNNNGVTSRSLLSTFWKNEYNEGLNVTAKDLDN